MEIGIKVVAENIRTQVVRHAQSCFFTMGAVDEQSRPAAVSPLTPTTPDEKRRFEAAKLRRQLRQELDRRFRAIQSGAVDPATSADGAPNRDGQACGVAR